MINTENRVIFDSFFIDSDLSGFHPSEYESDIMFFMIMEISGSI